MNTLSKVFTTLATFMGSTVMFHGSHANYPNVEKTLAVVALIAAGFVFGSAAQSQKESTP